MPIITRLWFDGQSGLARHEGVTVDLTALPRVRGLPPHMRAIDFAPAMRVAMVRESSQAWREMEKHECACVLEFLAEMVKAVRATLGVQAPGAIQQTTEGQQ